MNNVALGFAGVAVVVMLWGAVIDRIDAECHTQAMFSQDIAATYAECKGDVK